MVRSVALIILYDKERRILLQHRDENIRRLPGYWAFFGGGIKSGEDPEETIKRETLEELNYILRDPKLIMVQKLEDKSQKELKYVFVEKYINKNILKLQEGQGMDWYRISDTGGLKMADYDRKILDYIKDKF